MTLRLKINPLFKNMNLLLCPQTSRRKLLSLIHNMIVRVTEMTDKEKEKLLLLFELIKNARKSDREIAKTLRISQPTITRKRASLDKEGYIREYTVIPNLEKMGYEIIAVSFLAFSESRPELTEKAREWCKQQPSVIFSAGGEGLGMHSVLVSVHKNYASFSKLITTLREDWQPNLKEVTSFLMSINRKELVYKPFSFRYLEETPE